MVISNPQCRNASTGHAETMLVLNNDVNVRMRAALLKWQKVAEGMYGPVP